MMEKIVATNDNQNEAPWTSFLAFVHLWVAAASPGVSCELSEPDSHSTSERDLSSGKSPKESEIPEFL